MTNSNYTTSKSILNGEITFISAVNNVAQLSTEKEVHIHYDQVEIYYFLDGDLYFAFEGKQIPVEKGSIVIIDSGTLHRPIIKSKKRYERKRIKISKNIFHRFNTAEYDLYSNIHKRKILIFTPDTLAKSGCDKLFSEIETSINKNTPYENFSALLNIFSLLLKAVKYSKSEIFTSSEIKSNKTEEILKFINQNLNENLTYKSLAKRFYISEKNLYKIFKKETGFTLSEYIKERRIIMAISLLNSGISACEAAEQTGFSDYSVFYRLFIKKVGMKPSDYYKKENRK
ncbi:MAG: helix-turn-helix domain-containing protein [Ruminococcaceae bacterium]|nr:helix-turn-helix domain-containing protein [Oscillospiraceae bacterium]